MQIGGDKLISILTYNVKHRKTYDVLCLLKAKGYNNVNVYAVPFHYKKKHKPLIEHRPVIIPNSPSTEDICNNFGYNYFEGSLESFSISSNDTILICGSGILPQEFVKEHIVINSHPGYIPNCRGLDALKWAIYEDMPIGVTTHIIGEYVDAGNVIERRLINIQPYDTFHSLAQRVYENEISMLVEAIDKTNTSFVNISPGEYILHKRMSNEIEKEMLLKFEKKVKNL